MSDIEQRARDALNVVSRERRQGLWHETWHRRMDVPLEAMCREIEAHDATKAENERLREALAEAREETLWNAYHTGHVKDGLWSHLFMSDGEWLAQECGFDLTEDEYPDDEIRAAIPKVARAALAGGANDG